MNSIVLTRAFVVIDALDKTGKAYTSVMSRFTGMASRIASIGARLSASMIMPTMALKKVISDYVKFEDQMLSLKAITGSNQKEFERMCSVARRFGKEVTFSVQQVAEAMTEMGRAGFSTKEIEDSFQSVLDFARATKIELKESADFISSTLKTFSAGPEFARKIADSLTAAANSSAVTPREIMSAMRMSASIMAQVGMDVKDYLEAIGALGNFGIRGTLAGTVMRRAGTKLSNEGMVEQFRKVGVEVYDKSGNMRNLIEVLSEYRNELKKRGFTDTQIIGRLSSQSGFGMYGAAGIIALSSAADGKGNRKFQELKDALDNSAGMAAIVAAEMDSGIGGAIRYLVASLQELNIVLGRALAPMVRNISGQIKGWTNTASVFFEKNQGIVTSAATAFIGLTALGTAMFVVGTAAMPLASTLGMIGEAFVGLTSVLSTSFGYLDVMVGEYAKGFMGGMKYVGTAAENRKRLIALDKLKEDSVMKRFAIRLDEADEIAKLEEGKSKAMDIIRADREASLSRAGTKMLAVQDEKANVLALAEARREGIDAKRSRLKSAWRINNNIIDLEMENAVSEAERAKEAIEARKAAALSEANVAFTRNAPIRSATPLPMPEREAFYKMLEKLRLGSITEKDLLLNDARKILTRYKPELAGLPLDEQIAKLYQLAGEVSPLMKRVNATDVMLDENLQMRPIEWRELEQVDYLSRPRTEPKAPNNTDFFFPLDEKGMRRAEYIRQSKLNRLAINTTKQSEDLANWYNNSVVGGEQLNLLSAKEAEELRKIEAQYISIHARGWQGGGTLRHKMSSSVNATMLASREPVAEARKAFVLREIESQIEASKEGKKLLNQVRNEMAHSVVAQNAQAQVTELDRQYAEIGTKIRDAQGERSLLVDALREQATREAETIRAGLDAERAELVGMQRILAEEIATGENKLDQGKKTAYSIGKEIGQLKKEALGYEEEIRKLSSIKPSQRTTSQKALLGEYKNKLAETNRNIHIKQIEGQVFGANFRKEQFDIKKSIASAKAEGTNIAERIKAIDKNLGGLEGFVERAERAGSAEIEEASETIKSLERQREAILKERGTISPVAEGKKAPKSLGEKAIAGISDEAVRATPQYQKRLALMAEKELENANSKVRAEAIKRLENQRQAVEKKISQYYSETQRMYQDNEARQEKRLEAEQKKLDERTKKIEKTASKEGDAVEKNLQRAEKRIDKERDANDKQLAKKEKALERETKAVDKQVKKAEQREARKLAAVDDEVQKAYSIEEKRNAAVEKEYQKGLKNTSKETNTEMAKAEREYGRLRKEGQPIEQANPWWGKAAKGKSSLTNYDKMRRSFSKAIEYGSSGESQKAWKEMSISFRRGLEGFKKETILFLKNLWGGSGMKGVFDSGKAIVSGSINLLKGLWESLKSGGTAIKGVFGWMRGAGAGGFLEAWKVFKTALGSFGTMTFNVLKILQNGFGMFWGMLRSSWFIFAEVIIRVLYYGNLWKAAFGAVVVVAAAIVGGFVVMCDIMNAVIVAGSKAIVKLIDLADGIGGIIWPVVLLAGATGLGALAIAIKAVYSVAGLLWNGLTSLASAFGKFLSSITNFSMIKSLENVANMFTGPLARAFDRIKSIFTDLITVVPDMLKRGDFKGAMSYTGLKMKEMWLIVKLCFLEMRENIKNFCNTSLAWITRAVRYITGGSTEQGDVQKEAQFVESYNKKPKSEKERLAEKFGIQNAEDFVKFQDYVHSQYEVATKAGYRGTYEDFLRGVDYDQLATAMRTGGSVTARHKTTMMVGDEAKEVEFPSVTFQASPVDAKNYQEYIKYLYNEAKNAGYKGGFADFQKGINQENLNTVMTKGGEFGIGGTKFNAVAMETFNRGSDFANLHETKEITDVKKEIDAIKKQSEGVERFSQEQTKFKNEMGALIEKEMEKYSFANETEKTTFERLFRLIIEKAGIVTGKEFERLAYAIETAFEKNPGSDIVENLTAGAEEYGKRKMTDPEKRKQLYAFLGDVYGKVDAAKAEEKHLAFDGDELIAVAEEMFHDMSIEEIMNTFSPGMVDYITKGKQIDTRSKEVRVNSPDRDVEGGFTTVSAGVEYSAETSEMIRKKILSQAIAAKEKLEKTEKLAPEGEKRLKDLNSIIYNLYRDLYGIDFKEGDEIREIKAAEIQADLRKNSEEWEKYINEKLESTAYEVECNFIDAINKDLKEKGWDDKKLLKKPKKPSTSNFSTWTEVKTPEESPSIEESYVSSSDVPDLSSASIGAVSETSSAVTSLLQTIRDKAVDESKKNTKRWADLINCQNAIKSTASSIASALSSKGLVIDVVGD